MIEEIAWWLGTNGGIMRKDGEGGSEKKCE